MIQDKGKKKGGGYMEKGFGQSGQTLLGLWEKINILYYHGFIMVT